MASDMASETTSDMASEMTAEIDSEMTPEMALEMSTRIFETANSSFEKSISPADALAFQRTSIEDVWTTAVEIQLAQGQRKSLRNVRVGAIAHRTAPQRGITPPKIRSSLFNTHYN
jgi:hypothetical protein